MPTWAAGLLATLGTTAIKMLMSLVTEAFLKKSVIALLEKVVAKTADDTDDKLLKAAKESWGA